MTRFVCTYDGAYDEAVLARICERHGVPRLVAQALVRRGLTGDAEIDVFLHPLAQPLHDPFLLTDMDKAFERIRTALARGERICIYGDYDADGVCATAILLRCLRGRTDRVEAFIPSRFGEGYGMNPAAVERLHAKGIQLIITVDNGIAARAESELCASLGVDLIVTDHHQPGPALPDCCAVVAPTRTDSVYPNASLSGAGVALQLVRALSGCVPDAVDLALAATAAIADVVPLTGENRVIAAKGLASVRACPGLKALLDVSGAGEGRADAMTVAYMLAPRLNAAGRMGDAARALELLLSEDGATCARLAAELNRENQRRREEENAVLAGAEAQVRADAVHKRCAIVASAKGWHQGVLGIVAARLAERYARPAIVLTEDGDGLLHGSARSIPGIDLYGALSEHADRFVRFGGHAGAAGLTMQIEKLDGFADAFSASICAAYAPEAFEQTVYYEQALSLDVLDLRSVEALSRLAPFGEGNPEPVYRLNDAAMTGVRRIGADQKHLSTTVRQCGVMLRAVWFGMGERADRLSDAEPWSLLAQPSISRFSGGESVELRLVAAQPGSDDTQNFFDAICEGILYNKNVVLLQTLAGPFPPALRGLAFGDADMRARYKRIRTRWAKDGLTLKDAREACSAADLAAVLVFAELGFFRFDAEHETLTVEQSPEKRRLEESKLYGYLNCVRSNNA